MFALPSQELVDILVISNVLNAFLIIIVKLITLNAVFFIINTLSDFIANIMHLHI